jgi:hypothetical protein
MYKSINTLLKLSAIATASLVIFLGFTVRNPEGVILGKWEETDWTYEKIENESVYDLGLAEIKKHEAEQFVFTEDNQVEFYKNGRKTAAATWTIKGRGHILRIDHEDGSMELFDIKELNDDELILNFDIGMETRGIAKLIFSR